MSAEVFTKGKKIMVVKPVSTKEMESALNLARDWVTQREGMGKPTVPARLAAALLTLHAAFEEHLRAERVEK